MTLALTLLIFVPMLFEAARSAANEQRQRARGGMEADGDVYPAMRIAYPASFLAMLAEGALLGPVRPGLMPAGLIVFAAAKLIKWSAIAALGPHWTFRVIVVRGDPLVTRGPYRYVRHPNYIGVVGELIGAALLTRAVVTGPIALVAFAMLLRKRIAVEERALEESGHTESGHTESGRTKSGRTESGHLVI